MVHVKNCSPELVWAGSCGFIGGVIVALTCFGGGDASVLSDSSVFVFFHKNS